MKVVLVSDHSSDEGNRPPLCEAVQRVLGVTPVLLDSRSFLAGGAGRATVVDGRVVLEAPDQDVMVAPDIVLVYEIPVAKRRRFEPFQRKLQELGAVCLGTEAEGWRNATEKDRMVRCFVRDGIRHMETITLRRPSRLAAQRAFRLLGQNVWTRPTIGTEGDHVFHVTTNEQLHDVVRHYEEAGLAWLMSTDAENFDAEGRRHDFRVIVLQGRPLVASERGQDDPHQPCNEARGGSHRQVPLDDLPGHLIPLAVSATRSMGLSFGGVDLSVEKGVVFEVNVHPALFPPGYTEAVAVPLVEAHLNELERSRD